MSNVHKFPLTPEVAFEPPTRIMRPCDYGLWLAVEHLVTELGTVEAYNRLAEAASHLKTAIDKGKIKAQNPIYSKSVRGDVRK